MAAPADTVRDPRKPSAGQNPAYRPPGIIAFPRWFVAEAVLSGTCRVHSVL